MNHRTAPTECPPAPRSHRWLWTKCWQGHIPAEALTTKDREDLVWNLVEAGWNDQQIATHTHMTIYTTTRIRERLQLAPNHTTAGAA